MKVALLIDCYNGKFIGGGQIHILNLVLNLEKNHNCKIKIFSQPYSNIIIRFLWSLWIIPQVIFSNFINHFNLIHSHGYIPGFPAKIISLILHIPVIHTVHGSNLIDQNLISPKAKLEKFLLTQIRYNAQIVVNQNFLNYKNKTKTQIVIPNGVNLPHSYIKNNSSIMRFLFIGRLEKIKGLNILIKALSKLKFENWQLNIVGEGSQKNELISLAQKLNLCQKIIFHGRKKQLSKFYQNADIFILPSITEGQPITLLEAWSYKLPVIATKVGSNPYIIENNKDGILIEPNNIKELSKAITFLIKYQKQAKLMGENGYQKIYQNFTWDKIAQKTFFVYESVLKQK